MSGKQEASELERGLREALALRRMLRERMAETETERESLQTRFVQNENEIARTLSALGHPGPVAMMGLDGREPRSSSITRPPLNRPTLKRDIKPASLRLRHLNVPQAAAILLEEASRPQHVHELHNKMLENGLEFRGAHPAISIAVSLSRSKKFRKVAPGTFALADLAEPGQRAS
ncbi:MAG: hypothetical protein HY650_05780 [Acidobacteria bacterium]|nr:hypothetical protein [Acidobacteriota bacterium]